LADGTRVWDLRHGILFSHRDERGDPVNRKKASCFLTAARICHAEVVDVLAMVDADMSGFYASQFKTLVEAIRDKPDVYMTRSNYYQFSRAAGEERVCPLNVSGFRAVRMSALDPLFAKNVPDKWKMYFPEIDPDYNPRFLPSGFQLEIALEALVPWARTTEVSCTPIPNSRSAGGGAAGLEAVDSGIEWGKQISDYRQGVANRFWVLNVLKAEDPGNRVVGKLSARDMRRLAESVTWDHIGQALETSDCGFAKNMLILMDLKAADPKWMDYYFYNAISSKSGRQLRRKAETLAPDEIDTIKRGLDVIPAHVTERKRQALERLRKRVN
jgi:hypothetical protein